MCGAMSTKARRFSINIDRSIPPDADDLFEQVSGKYEFLTYVGVYTNDGKLYIYLQFENLVVQSKLNRILVEMGIAMNGIVKSKRMIGEILSEHGEMPKMGRVPKKRKHVDQIPSSPQTIINSFDNSASIVSVDNGIQIETRECPPKKARFSSTELKVNKSVLIHDEVYVQKTFGTPSPDMFHAIWSSTDGLWSPHMWVGPMRNIVPMPRKSIKPQVIQELFEEQESKCRLCRTNVFMGTYSNSDVDHIVPLRYGGSCLKSNLQVLCVTCHRRKTALECKKVFTLMGSSEVDWGVGKVYIANTHVHYKPEVVHSKNPKAFLEQNCNEAGLFVLEY